MSNIGDKIKEDGVGMRWIRTAAATVTASAAASGVLYGVLVWLVTPRFKEFSSGIVYSITEQLREDVKRNGEQGDRLEKVVASLNVSVNEIIAITTVDLTPSWVFDPVDTAISDGDIGGPVTVTASGYKMRDCGIPIVDMYFANGNNIYHRFSAVSLLTPDNRGIAVTVDPARIQKITYIAIIPDDDNVKPGRAAGFISLYYPDKCPKVDPIIAGPLQFRIGAQKP